MTIKIRTKLLMIMLMIAIITAIPVTLLSMDLLIKSSKATAMDFGKTSAYYNSEIIKTWLTEKSKILVGLKSQLISKNNYEEITALLRSYSEINPDFISIFVGLENNEMIDAYGWEPDQSYDVTLRPWYQKAMNQDAYVTTSVYRDFNKKVNVTAIASSVEIAGLEGVIAANIYVDYIVEIIDDIKYGDHGFAVLLDDNLNLITGPKDTDKLVVFHSIFDKLQADGKVLEAPEAFEVELAGVDYIAAYSSIEGYDWKLFLLAPLSDFTQSAAAMRERIMYISVITVLLIFMIDFYLSRSLSRPIEALISSVSRIAKGNLDTRINIRTQDEIGDLSIELDKMRSNLKQIFESLKYESSIINMNSQNLIQHLEETRQGTSRFLSMLSHDIKTPITLIKGYSKALSMDMVDPYKAKAYVERIQYRTDQIENIVTDILDNTYEANNIHVNLKEIKISDYVNMILYNTENYLSNQKRALVIQIDPMCCEDESVVAVDLTKIQRVINNLLSNAVKFSVEDSEIELIIRLSEGRLLTCIRDYGIGIKEEEQEKIFNMFYKSDGTQKGYGLGLYINKAIIEAHDGEILFESSFGEGTASGYFLNIKA
ncbi:sensor histidine kinase [Acidaminobacter hydrogenoformans]|uniref:histidine kinase n=1 Tax=Acidaminobacter hydrogenoformans DSM 2784 TaxID=1120920 RepID=A0A1G5S3Z1_9FIRM|nr:sensor histidine kinase [Acidaminobacter hydrogenoformans]SCZ81085.1 Signal transduction histidine kinase [Acidaminobacter hydrogenoformans DSM 2784]